MGVNELHKSSIRERNLDTMLISVIIDHQSTHVLVKKTFSLSEQVSQKMFVVVALYFYKFNSNWLIFDKSVSVLEAISRVNNRETMQLDVIGKATDNQLEMLLW